MRRVRASAPASVKDYSLAAIAPELDAAGFPILFDGPRPMVSVVIPAHNQAELTLRCLRSLSNVSSKVAFEVVLVDDGSDPEAFAGLEATRGLTLVRHEEARGFVQAANAGAAVAVGEFLLFLNNDTVVLPRAITALHQALTESSNVGLVGGQLISMDGLVQEAGGVVWRDGSATNFGRGLHPDHYSVRYKRKVDYCSGACLMIRRKLFEDLGGFEEAYSPGYYEDVDLAFRVRDLGLDVVYQPRAQILHVEGATAGRDVKSGMKQHQVHNRDVFAERFGAQLYRQPERRLATELAKDRGITRRCLIVDSHLPLDDRDAGGRRLFNILEEIVRLGWLPTLAAYDLRQDEPRQRALEALGVEVVVTPHAASVQAEVQRRGKIYDLILLSRVGVASRLINEVRKHAPQARLVFDTVDLKFLRDQRQAEVTEDAALARKAVQTRELELGVVEQADLTLVTSPVERKFLQRAVPDAEVRVVPTYYEIQRPTLAFTERSGGLFVGSFRHQPNLDGISWFLADVLPQILAVSPGFQLHVVGEEPPDSIAERGGANVVVHGYVDDLSALYERCQLSVAPLRFGAGLKGKVHESLAKGLPCVTTRIAAEGLALMPDLHVVLADGAPDFASGVLRLQGDRDLWQRLSVEGQAHVRKYFSPAQFKGAVHAALSGVMRRAQADESLS